MTVGLSSELQMELLSADPEASLRAVLSAGIDAKEISIEDGLQIRFWIHARDQKLLTQIADKRGDLLRVIDKKGFAWDFRILKKRPVLVLGILFMLIFSLWLPGRVLFVQVEGNITVATRQILEKAAQCGITFGASGWQVRSEKIKNALLEAMPQLSWAGIETKGCTAVISVRERLEEKSDGNEHPISSIVASKDGVIRQLTVMRGNALCSAGQSVKQGQVLISGYTDCGISVLATQAEGEVFAETNHEISVIMPQKCYLRTGEQRVRKKYGLIIGKKRVNFKNSSGILGVTCAKIYEEKYVTLPGGFVLPLGVAIETWHEYDVQESTCPDTELLLQTYARGYILQQMIAGSIEHATEDISSDEECFYLTGAYSCCEMIGVTRIEENMLEWPK